MQRQSGNYHRELVTCWKVYIVVPLSLSSKSPTEHAAWKEDPNQNPQRPNPSASKSVRQTALSKAFIDGSEWCT
jgi:hypothetical protein